ncbi:MAG: glycosyltransferase family 1 protein [Catonella sp.]|nr:glycosyltransferase family 1 protein [Catonella sp.]
MNEPKRVLIGGFTENVGGLETYVMNIYRNIDRNKLQFDFLKMSSTIAYEDEIKALGGEVLYVPGRSKGIKAHYDVLKQIFTSTHYVALYYQCNRRLDSLDTFRYAKKYGVGKRIIHSHNTKDAPETKLRRVKQWMVSGRVDKYLTHRFACSNDAGKWMFGDHKFTVIPNSVDTELFKYNAQIRDRKRNELGIADNTLVIGNVARLSEQKNPMFMLDVFEAVHRKRPDSILLQIGTGELKEQFFVAVKDKHLEESVKILGIRSDVNELLSAMDVFLLPSNYEGFPIVLVEAQCNGLPCIASDVITRDCNMTRLVKYVSLSQEADVWADEVLKATVDNRTDYYKKIEQAGYSTKAVATRMEKFFTD